MTVRFITDKTEKKSISSNILHSLPAWFGIPSATANYIEQSAEMPFIAAFEDNNAIAFIAVKETSPSAVEIYVMGVLPQYHRKGAGKALIDSCTAYCKDKGYALLHVKTLAPSHPDEHYEMTRRFYTAMGFLPLETMKELWDEDNPCLLMVKPLK